MNYVTEKANNLQTIELYICVIKSLCVFEAVGATTLSTCVLGVLVTNGVLV
jgi:hypothetical protein